MYIGLVTCTVGLKIEIHEIHEIHQNLRNPVSINRNPPSATKSTATERKLILEIQHKPTRHEIKGYHEIQYALTKSTHSHTISGEHSTRMLKFKIEATSMALSQPTVPWWCSVVSNKDWLEDHCTYIGLLNRTNQLRLWPIGLYPASMHRVTFLAISGRHCDRGPCARLLSSLHLRCINDSHRHADASVHQGQLNITMNRCGTACTTPTNVN